MTRASPTRVTFGAKGTFGARTGITTSASPAPQYKLDENSWVRFADAIDGYFESHVLGPQLGCGSLLRRLSGIPAQLRRVLHADVASRFRKLHRLRDNSQSKTSDNLLRAQVTNSACSHCRAATPAWRSSPKAATRTGNTPGSRLPQRRIWGQTAVAGGGDRDRYAADLPNCACRSEHADGHPVGSLRQLQDRRAIARQADLQPRPGIPADSTRCCSAASTAPHSRRRRCPTCSRA